MVVSSPMEILNASFMHKSERFCENSNKTNKSIFQ